MAELVIERAHTCLRAAESAMAEDRLQAREDLAYKAGQQWDGDVLQARGKARPTLTINKIPSFLKQVINTYKQNRPGIAVAPVDSGADKQTAEVIAGMQRHMFYASQGDVALDTAFESAVDIGFGYFRVLTDYVDDHSFDQEILYAPILDPFSVYFDPTSVMPDGSDADECVLTSLVLRESLHQTYGDEAALMDFGGEVRQAWRQDERALVQIAEYFYVDTVADRLLLLADGRTLMRSEVPHGQMALLRPLIVRERAVSRRQVKWAKLTGTAILEERDWPGRHIPVVPIYGERILVDDAWRYFGMIRWLRDPQTMLNYWESAKTEMLAQMPKSKWVGAAGQFEGYEDQWRTANVSNQAYLEYNTRDLDGNPVPAPQRQFPDPPPQGFIEASLHSAQHMKEISGIYDASLGNRSNETSGVAIATRQNQGSVANFHFFDNAMRSLRHAQRIILDLIPAIYDTPRVARILGEDRQAGLVPVNQQAIDRVTHDLTVGKYDVILRTGPNFQTRRQEAAAQISELLRTWPALADIAGDYLLQNLDWPDADGIATRWRMAKGLQPEGETLPPEEQLQQAQQQLQQAQQQLQALNAYAQQQEAACQKLAQAHAALQADQDIEMRKLALQEEELRLKAQMEAQKIALEEQRIALDAQAHGVPAAEVTEGVGLIVQGLQSQIAALRDMLLTDRNEPSQLPDV